LSSICAREHLWPLPSGNVTPKLKGGDPCMIVIAHPGL
jgi:hypothetical protein